MAASRKGIMEERVKAVLAEALQVGDPLERRAFLEHACAGNEQLRHEVESLLKAFEQSGDFFNRTMPLAAPDHACECSGSKIGHYKLLEKIGEGGFGVVWMAEQEEPVRRRVALKIIKMGMDTREVVARFEAERQALAMMDHPNIARVFDGGATEEGRPYFVMELVKGIPITEYCDVNKLSTRERLELFLQVCHAVQHAHQKGVIHRDLKPSNVMVTVQDDRAVPKVIDFGVAKATQAPLTSKTLFTRFHQWIGTPAYMSPEQAGLGSLDVDTRSDIYSLGVLLYELLTGRPPFDTQKLLAAGYDAVMRTIREDEPPKPSTRLRTLAGEELSAVAANRSAEPAKLGRLVEGDLDWVVMKALEKDRTRRYETAATLAQDLTRHLAHKPVLANPPHLTYVLAKFVRRHRVGVGFAAALVLAILLGTGMSVWQAVRASRQAELAEARRFEADKSRQTAAAAQRQTEQAAQALSHQLAHEYVDKAALPLKQGDYFASVIWLSEALRLEASDPTAAAMHRLRLGSVLRASPTLIQVITHKGWVSSVEISPDGKRLLTGSFDGTARVWDAQTGAGLSPSLVHTSAVICASFSPDAQRVVTASFDHTARVWDAWSGLPITPPLAHASNVLQAAFSPDGRRIVTASEDHTARVWEASTGRPVGLPLRHGDVIFPAVFSPDGRLIATASWDKTAQVWDAETGRPVTPPLRHEGRVWWVAFSPDGSLVATTGEDKTARVWDARTGAQRTPPLQHGGEVVYVAFSPDGRRLVTGTGKSPFADDSPLGLDVPSEARLWEVASGTALGAPMKHLCSLLCVAFSPDGRWVVTASADRTARVWNATTGQPRTPPLLHADAVFRAVFSPDSRRLATASLDGSARIWDIDRHEPASVELQESWAGCDGRFSFSPDGQHIAGTYWNGDGRIWDATTGAPITGHLHTNTIVRQITFSQDGRAVATASADHSASIWDAQTGAALTPPLRHSGEIVGVAFSPDGSRLATASDDGTARIWDAKTGAALTQPLRHGSNVVYVAFSPNGRRVATGSEDRTARLWDGLTGAAAGPPLAHKDGVILAVFSPDSHRLVTASWDGVAQVWDVETSRPVAPAIKVAGRFIMLQGIESIAFSPDGRRIVIADSDRTARVWDVQTGAPVAPPLQHGEEVLYAAFSNQGRYIVTTSADKTARVWDATTGQPLTPPLEHNGIVTRAWFTANDDALNTISHDPVTHVVFIRRWDLTPDPRPAEKLRTLGELLSVNRLDATGTQVPLTPNEVSNAWRILNTP